MKIASRIMMGIAGLLLIVASVLKIDELLSVPANPDAYIVDTWLWGVIQVPLELGLGIWLISGLFKKGGWLIAQIGYGVFIGVTIWRFATGQESCGCFGTVHVDPRITLFAIDIPIFLGLAIFYPRKEKLLPPPWPHPFHLLAVAFPTGVLLGAIVPILIFNQPDAEKIVSKPVPVKPPVKIDIDINTGINGDNNNNNTNTETTNTTPDNNNQATVGEDIEVNPDTVSISIEPNENIGNTEVNTGTLEPAENNDNSSNQGSAQTNQSKENPDNNTNIETPNNIDTTNEEPVVDTEPNEPVTNLNTTEDTAEPEKNTETVTLPSPDEWDSLKNIDIADTLRKGIKITLLYRDDCYVCHMAIPMFEEYAEMFGTDDNSVRIAFVELPPYGNDPEHSMISADTKCLLGKYISDEMVYGMTPIIAITSDGVPIASWDGADTMPTFEELIDAMMGD